MQIYKIGVELMLLGNINAAISALSKNLLGIGAQVKQLQTGFTGLKAAITGALTAYAGVKTLDFLGKMVKHGNEIVHQQQLMRELGMSQAEVNEATAKSFENSAKVQTTTVAENLKHLRELRYAFGDLTKAQQALQQVSEANSILQNVAGPGAGDQVWDFVKALEIKGPTIDPKLFADYIDKMTMVVGATGGKVTPKQFFSAFKYGRTAMQGWDEDFIMGALPRSIQSMSGGGGSGGGAGGPGNALQSVFAALVQGQMSKTAGAEFSRLGIGTERKIKGSSKDMVDVAGKDLAIKNPYEWVQNVLMPALAAKGITSQTDITAEIGKMFPNRTAGQMMTEYALQGRFREGKNSQFEKDIALHKQPMGAHEGYQFLLNNDLNMQMKAFTAQWNAMLEALGAPLVSTAIGIMKNFTGAFTWVTQFAGVHPEIIKAVGEALGALAVGLIVFGGAAMVVAVGVLGGLPAVIAGVVTALGTLIAIHWDALKGYITGLGEGIAWFGNAMMKDWKSAFAGLVSGLQSLWDKLKGFFGQGEPDNTLPPGFAPGAYHGGGRFMPINYETSNGPSMGGSPSTGGGVALHSGGGFIASRGGSSSTGGGAIGGPQIPAGVTGNAFIQAMRSPFAKELQDPNVRLQFMGMMLSEGGSNGVMPLADAESAMNRANFAGKSLMQMLHSGFYGPIKHGMLPKFMAEIRRNPALAARLNAYINQALGGSDIIHGHTDQGNLRLGDPGAAWENAHSRDRFGSEIFGDWLFGKGTQQWRENFEAGARGSAVPPPKSPEVHIHTKTILDGRVISENSMKHIATGGEKAASGGRMYDRSYTRPITI